MITKVSLSNFNNQHYQTRKYQYSPSFQAVKLYNDRTATYTLKLKLNNFYRKLHYTYKKFIKNIPQHKNNSANPEEIKKNNKFIAKVQNKISSYGAPAGEFKSNNGDIIIVKTLGNGQKKIDLYLPDDEIRNIPLRSATIDDEGIIKTYETSYPWRIFTQTDKGYVCTENSEAYFKHFASDSLLKWDVMMPRQQ